MTEKGKSKILELFDKFPVALDPIHQEKAYNSEILNIIFNYPLPDIRFWLGKFECEVVGKQPKTKTYIVEFRVNALLKDGRKFKIGDRIVTPWRLCWNSRKAMK